MSHESIALKDCTFSSINDDLKLNLIIHSFHKKTLFFKSINKKQIEKRFIISNFQKNYDCSFLQLIGIQNNQICIDSSNQKV